MVHGERLLLVEDDAATREVLTLLLAGEGWAVDAVESGEAAMEALAAGLAPAVVLCDLQLPGICGEALLARVRQHLSEDAVVLATTCTARRRRGTTVWRSSRFRRRRLRQGGDWRCGIDSRVNARGMRSCTSGAGESAGLWGRS